MPIIKLFKKVYKEILFLLMVTCLSISIIINHYSKRNKQYVHLSDTFYYNNQKTNMQKYIITLSIPKLLL